MNSAWSTEGAPIARALAAVADAQSEIDAIKAKSRTVQSDKAAAERERSDLVEGNAAEAASRILGGDSAAADDGKRLKRIAALENQIVGSIAAAPILNRQAAIEAEKLKAAEFHLVDAVLRATQPARVAQVELIRDALLPLAPLLSELWAIDLVQEALVSDRPMFSGVPGLFSGRIVANSFLAKVSDRLRPDCLNPAHIAQAAETRAAEILNQIKEIKP